MKSDYELLNRFTKTKRKLQDFRNKFTIFILASSLPFLGSCSDKKSSNSVSDEAQLPALDEKAYENTPLEVIHKVQEIFNQRFAKVNDDYYQVYIHYSDNIALRYKKSMQEVGNEKLTAAVSKMMLKGIDNNNDPHLLGATLFQLKDLKTTITPITISDTDKLNHITWRGEVKITAKHMRQRNLDLLQQLRDLKSATDTSKIPFTSPGATLSPCGMSWIEYFELIKKKQPNSKEDPLAMMNSLFGAQTNQILDTVAKNMTGSDWGKWKNAEEYTFQKCVITIQNGTIYYTSEEDAKDVPGNAKSFSTLPPLSGVSSSLYSSMNDRYVSIKPDVDHLDKLGLLVDAPTDSAE